MRLYRRLRLAIVIGFLILFPFGLTSRTSPFAQTAEEIDTVHKLNHYLEKALIGQWQYACMKQVQKDEIRYEFIVTQNAAGEAVSGWTLREKRQKSAFFEYSLRQKGRKISEKRIALSRNGEKVFVGNDEEKILPYKAKGIILNPMQYLNRLMGSEVEYVFFYHKTTDEENQLRLKYARGRRFI